MTDGIDSARVMHAGHWGIALVTGEERGIVTSPRKTRSAAAGMGYYGSPVILTGTSTVAGGVSAFLDAHAYEIGRVDVFGGTGVVGSGVMRTIVGKVK